MSLERLNTRKAIQHATPEAQAYWRELNAASAARKANALPEFDTPVCPECSGYGVVRADFPVGHPEFGKLFPCPNPDCETLKALRAERYAKLCTLAQIPAEYAGLSFDTWRTLFKQTPLFRVGKQDAVGAALAFVHAYERGFSFTLDEAADLMRLPHSDNDGAARSSIVYSGIPGVGKTSLAICIARELIDVYQTQVVYLLMDEFFKALHERFDKKKVYQYGGDASDEAELISFYQQAPVLIIDEFPRKPGTSEWWEQSVYQLVNYRYVHQMPTVITTNLDALTLMHEWGDAIISRIQAMSHWFAVSGEELRRRAPEVVSR